MNSPPEPGSPSPSTPSSGSPPPDEMEQMEAASHGTGPGSFLGKFTNSLSNIGTSSSTAKRRLPGGPSFGAASNTRDPKSRRTQEGKDRERRGGAGESWGEGKRKDKDELLDSNLVEQLRKEFGDPFLDDDIKNRA